ncbi:somatoliberin isoform X1 [Arvicola amphibius]|uniref:somatoliberin isoform X1 n=1 Tax=Arvicola amphibius TaxID=1047088 RepID=UPI0018E38D57|nr:somatoliberin isoform X1 [Arvicola amphibius]
MPLWVFFVILTLTSGSHCLLPTSLPFRMRRYADAIFTNSYRKVLGQLSARKLLQDIMNRQQGERNQEGTRVRPGRQVDSMWADHRQVALESLLQGFPRMKPSAEAWATRTPNNWTQLLPLQF